MDEVYIVEEVSTSAGSYVSKNPISFTYTWNDNAAVLTLLDDGDDTILSDTKGNLYWQEPQVIVSILKVDTAHKPLEGATLQIRDSQGQIVSVIDSTGKEVLSWKSTKDAFVITGHLSVGETYWLHELEAPKGYVKTTPKKLSIDSTPVAPNAEKIVKVELVNTIVPKTGDNNELIVYGSMFGVSCTIALSLLIYGKKRKNDES